MKREFGIKIKFLDGQVCQTTNAGPACGSANLQQCTTFENLRGKKHREMDLHSGQQQNTQTYEKRAPTDEVKTCLLHPHTPHMHLLSQNRNKFGGVH